MPKTIYSGQRGAAGKHGGATAGFKDATTLEEAVDGMQLIKRRQAADRAKTREAEIKARITLSPTLDDWLKKEIP